jgi:alkanesulfonate monooxygenase SsuD/methylene tetrahydromethanopterin reductase-like flavin-dependent oxidoreductase (luciferase family)
MNACVQIGIDSFAAAHDDTSRALSATQRLRNLIEEIEHADQVGLDVFGIGEHHRKDFLDSAPAVILGAAAARTSRIRLTSAVTVLSSADPVRVFQNFATLDLISQGRAEMVVGRGSFTDSFPLFGFRLIPMCVAFTWATFANLATSLLEHSRTRMRQAMASICHSSVIF